jgi:hypothetical protein
MHTFGTITLLAGILTMGLAQLYMTTMTIRARPGKAIFFLVVPGYALFVAKRTGFYGKFLSVYATGILGLIIGASIIS